MGEIKLKSIKWKFLVYVPFCVLFSYLGVWGIGHGTNYVQDWYYSRFAIGENWRFDWIGSLQIILMPLWVLGCVFFTGICFYNQEMKKPLDSLMHGAKKIAENELDFRMDYRGEDELGVLCGAFEDMRKALYENNRQMWRTLEERKKLNAAFSHDLRTPLTVLQGYVDYLEKYVPEGKVSEEKLLSILAMMNGQVTRLTHYTQRMNALQKLEDVKLEVGKVALVSLLEQMQEIGEMMKGDKLFRLDRSDLVDATGVNWVCSCILVLDKELLLQIYENLLSNAFRHAYKSVAVYCSVWKDYFQIQVFDDGDGFSVEALQQATKPFYKEEKHSEENNLGLGLYICRVLCEKCGGELTLRNGLLGGIVTAEVKIFSGKKSIC